MEDQCWSDTILSADPDREGGGRTDGLGSLYEYALHCHNAEHIKCRDKRLAKQVSEAEATGLTAGSSHTTKGSHG